jgi:hypothetical protein
MAEEISDGCWRKYQQQTKIKRLLTLETSCLSQLAAPVSSLGQHLWLAALSPVAR